MTYDQKEQIVMEILKSRGLEFDELCEIVSTVFLKHESLIEKERAREAQRRRNTYLGKCYVDTSESKRFYYKVVFTEAGSDDASVSCVSFMEKPSLFYGVDVNDRREVWLPQNSKIICCDVLMDELDGYEEITPTEFYGAYMEWAQEIYASSEKYCGAPQ